MKKIIVCIILLLFVEVDVHTHQNEPLPKQNVQHHVPFGYEEAAINMLIKYEGFRSEVYFDNDGSPTIGYGHHILKGEKFNTPITEIQARQLLIKDFYKRLSLIEKDGIKDNRKYALACFVFNCGEGNWRHSTLRKFVLKDTCIKKEITRWKWASINGKKKVLKRLEERRKQELDLYLLAQNY